MPFAATFGLGHCYGDLLQDWPRAIYWYQQAEAKYGKSDERTIDMRLVEMTRNQPTAAALTDRIATIERVLDQRIGEIGRNWVAVGERLQALELSTRRPPEATLPPLVAARLETLGSLEQKLDAAERAFSMILDRLSGLERQIGAVQTKIADLAPEPFVRRWGER